MKTHVRILLAAALVVLLAGWVGLRRGNAVLAARLAAAPAERAGGPGGREPKASVPPVRMEVGR